MTILRNAISRPMLTGAGLLLMLAATAGAQGVFVPASFLVLGDAAGDNLGYSISGAGDVNNDGFDDFVVGAHQNDENGSNAGSATVFSGTNCAILYTFYGDAAGDLFGVSVSGAEDVNNDGFDDLIVGARDDDDNGTNSGSARVYSGFDGTILRTFLGDSPLDAFGISVSGAGDVNNDGFADLIVGARADDNNGAESGSARVFSGIDGSILYTFNGDNANDFFGHSVSGAGDVNNDGFDDLIVGAYLDDNNGSGSGSARVFSGIDGSILYTFNGDNANDNFGISVGGAGDVNNDGSDDLVVGANLDDNTGTDSGSVRVLSGMDGAILHTFNGDAAGDYLGFSVDGAGDVDNDGFADLVAGAYFDDNNGTSSGSARAYSGATGDTLFTFIGDGPFDNAGFSVAAAGDANNDGYDDLVVGSPLDDNAGADSGSARVFFSAIAPCAPQVAQCPGDADGNRVVNFADITEVLTFFGLPCP
jgi:hypothetical protein